jgi:hypothetical protein
MAPEKSRSGSIARVSFRRAGGPGAIFAGPKLEVCGLILNKITGFRSIFKK